MVQKEDGETNVERLAEKSKEMSEKGDKKKSESSSKKASQKKSPKPKKPSVKKQAKGFRIDTLTVTLGEAEMRTFQEGQTDPKVDVFKINKTQVLTDVTSAEDVVNQVVADVIASQLMQGMTKWSEDHEEDLEKLGLKKDDVKKVQDGLKSFFKGLQ